MAVFKSLFLICLSVWFVLAKHEEYDGYTLYEVVTENEEQGSFIRQLEEVIPMDIWLTPQPGRPGHVFISKDRKEQFEEVLTGAQVEFKVSVGNIKERLDREDEILSTEKLKNSGKLSRALSLTEIHRYDEVNAYLDRLGREYPNRVTVVTAGRSFEGRDIKYLRISSSNFQDRTKPVVYLQSLLHAREWLTLPASLYAIQKLVVDVTESDLVNDIDWIILPIANPDGYEWSHTNARFWRKNRATGYITGNVCLGVDLNRNFDIFWGVASSSSVCADTFHGRSAFSEPETQAIRSILQQHSSRIGMYIDIHAYGSYILYGYGTGQLPPNALTVNLVGVNMAQTIDRVKWASNPNYVVGNIFNVLYAATGGASDYAQAIGIPLAYTYELPGYRNMGGFNGFLVDPDFIEQAGYETWEGIKTGARYVRNNFRTLG